MKRLAKQEICVLAFIGLPFMGVWNYLAWSWSLDVAHAGQYTAAVGRMHPQVVGVVSATTQPSEFWSTVVEGPAIGAAGVVFLMVYIWLAILANRRGTGAG